MFKAIFEFFFANAERARQNSLERRLSQAHDLSEIELMQRDWARLN